MSAPKIDRLVAGGSIKNPDPPTSGVELVLFVIVLCLSLLVLGYWGS
jgi:hypothetical protein